MYCVAAFCTLLDTEMLITSARLKVDDTVVSLSKHLYYMIIVLMCFFKNSECIGYDQRDDIHLIASSNVKLFSCSYSDTDTLHSV